MIFDVEKIRAMFPLVRNHPELHYLDNAATTLKPDVMLEALNEYYTEYSGNVHRGLYPISERATAEYEAARTTVAQYINAVSQREIVFTSGTTHAINLVAMGWARQHIKSGEEIVVSTLEHHSNLVPWQLLCKETGAKLIYWEPKPDGTIDPVDANTYLTRRTRLLAITHLSNVIGTLTPLKQVIQKAYAFGAKVLVDCAQSAPRIPIDVQLLDCDFLAFSGHKAYGPTGIGVLYAKEKHLEVMRPVFGGGGMIREVEGAHATWNDIPWKMEAGTPPIAEAIGMARSISLLKEIGLSGIHAHEKKLTTLCVSELRKIPGITVFGPQEPNMHESIVSFVMEGVHPHDIASLLGEKNVAIRAGHHCCMPLTRWLNVAATARVSFSMYNTESDVQALIDGLHSVKKTFKM